MVNIARVVWLRGIRLRLSRNRETLLEVDPWYELTLDLSFFLDEATKRLAERGFSLEDSTP